MISKSDWKLFREKLPEWQEKYMEKLVGEYVVFLSQDDKAASEKFWEMEKRIKKDRKNPGVIMELEKSEAIETRGFTGKVTVHFDKAFRIMCWKEGDEQYYPKGVVYYFDW